MYFHHRLFRIASKFSSPETERDKSCFFGGFVSPSCSHRLFWPIPAHQPALRIGKGQDSHLLPHEANQARIFKLLLMLDDVAESHAQKKKVLYAHF